MSNEQVQKKEQFFTDLGNDAPFLHAGFEGFAGSGKTHTSALLARGIHKKIGSTKPIAIFDTERASRFLKPLFAQYNINVLVRESRTMADLRETIRLCEGGASDILIIDSISHVWENFLSAYKEKVKRTRLEFQDWGTIKPAWKREFSDPFVQAKLHIMLCGRAGYEYETEKDPETGKKTIYKSGIKMKVEGETAYEPDVLVLMERFEEILGDDKKVWREATILKDRSNIIDGQTIKNPTFEHFEPVIDFLLMTDTSSTTSTPATPDTGLFVTDEERAANRRKATILLEEIEGLLTSVAPGQTKDEKKWKVDVLERAFDTRSWEKIKTLSLANLEGGLNRIKAEIEARQAGAVVDEDDLDPGHAVNPRLADLELASHERLDGFVLRLATIGNIHELRNWEKKHKAEFDSLMPEHATILQQKIEEAQLNLGG